MRSHHFSERIQVPKDRISVRKSYTALKNSGKIWNNINNLPLNTNKSKILITSNISKSLQNFKLEAQVGQKRSPGLGWSWYVTLCHGGHLGYQIRLPLVIQNLMLFEEFQDCHHGRFLGNWNWMIQQFWIPIYPDASHQVLAQSDLLFGRRCDLKKLKMAAILDIGTRILAIPNFHITPMPPIMFKLNQTFTLR